MKAAGRLTLRGFAAASLTLSGSLLLATNVFAAKLLDVSISNQGQRYDLRADIYIAAPLANVYKVLTDYNHLTRISGAITVSRVVKRVDKHTAIVYVETHACVAFFCRTLKQTQDVWQLGPNDIVAQSIPAKSNVSMGSASWHLEVDGKGTKLLWRNTVEPKFWIPPLVGTAMMDKALNIEVIASAWGIEKLAREWAHLPPLKPTQPPANENERQD